MAVLDNILEDNEAIVQLSRVFNEEDGKKAFVNYQPCKLHFHLPNGNWLSTIWGGGTYSDNTWGSLEGLDRPLQAFMGSDTVEVMFKCSDKLHKRLHKKFGGDGSIIGYISFQDWLYILNALAKDKLPKSKEKHE